MSTSRIEPITAPIGGELCLRLFFVTDIEMPKNIGVMIQYDSRIYPNVVQADLVVTTEPKLIEDTQKLPNRTSYIALPVSVTILENGERVFRENFNPMRIVTDDKYFEYSVHCKLREMGFESEWLGTRDPKLPDIKAFFKLYPTEIFDVQCTSENIYDATKLSSDYGKFMSERGAFQFTRLLVVTQFPDITSDAIERLRTYVDPVSIIRYVDLLQLAEQRRGGLLSKEGLYITLTQRGEIRTSQVFRIDPIIRKRVVIENLFRF